MGKPSTSDVVLPAPEYIGRVEGTWGSETSQYLQEEKTTCDSVSSGERKRMRLNRSHVKPAGVVWSGSWDDPDGSAELSGSQKRLC